MFLAMTVAVKRQYLVFSQKLWLALEEPRVVQLHIQGTQLWITPARTGVHVSPDPAGVRRIKFKAGLLPLLGKTPRPLVDVLQEGRFGAHVRFEYGNLMAVADECVRQAVPTLERIA